MIEILNGEIYINGKKTTNPELIGQAVLDFAESQENDNIKITLKEADVFIDLN
jgi:hypothetical protein